MANIHSQKKRILRSERRKRLENRQYTPAIKQTYFLRHLEAGAGGRAATEVRPPRASIAGS